MRAAVLFISASYCARKARGSIGRFKATRKKACPAA